MKNIIKKYITPLVIGVVMFSVGIGAGYFGVTKVAAQADLKNAACEGVALGGGGSCDAAGTDAATSKINTTITTVINILSFIVGVAAVIMIIIGGFRYVTSAGDSGNVTSAKNTILYAIVGLIVVGLSQFIVKFVLTRI